jgi:hypothetical protein
MLYIWGTSLFLFYRTHVMVGDSMCVFPPEQTDEDVEFVERKKVIEWIAYRVSTTTSPKLYHRKITKT